MSSPWRLALIGAIAVLVSGCDPAVTAAPNPSPSPSASAAPSTTAPVATKTPKVVTIPPEAMLAPEDLGSGYKVNEEELGDWSMEFLTQICQAYKDQLYPGTPAETAGRRERGLDGPKSVVQAVEISDVARARWDMEHTRAFVRDCARFTYEGAVYTLEIVATGFAGEESFLVKATYPKDGTTAVTHYAYVRQGELTTQVASYSGHSVEEMKAIARKAAQRLCQATTTC